MSTVLQKAGQYNQNLMDYLAGFGIFTPGEIYFWDPTNGSDSYDGKTMNRGFATLEYAEDQLTANQHDVLFYIAGPTAGTISSKVTWDKNYTHFIGLGSSVRWAMRTRIFHDENFSAMFDFSATGCVWSNIYMSYGRGGADNHILMNFTGGRNYFRNVHFAGMNHATEAADASSVALYMNAAHENFFDECVLGNNTIARSAANASLELAGESARNWFRKCYFSSYASAATPVAIKIGETGIDRELVLEDCDIVNHGTALTQAINSDITDPTARKIVVKGALNTVGCTDVADATGDGTIYVMPYTATANAYGLAINPAVS